MGDRALRNPTSEIADEAARIICEEWITDYWVAKRKALERLRLSPNAPMPENARIQQAVIAYQQLFGGDEYVQRLQALRRTAMRTMRLLQDFEPRAVGGVVSGAVSMGHRVQLHAFADKAEMLDVFLQARNIAYREDERDYRYASGGHFRAPMCCLDIEGIGVDVAIFPFSDLRRPPLSATDGQTVKRLTIVQIEVLLAADDGPTGLKGLPAQSGTGR